MKIFLLLTTLLALPLHAQKIYPNIREFSFNEEEQGDCKIHYQGKPDEVLKSFPNLKKLVILHCELERIPPIIFTLKKLEVLALSGNKIREIPKEIENLTQLRTLYLGGNQFKALPESIGHLMNLRELHLGYNQLSILPASIVNLINARVTLKSTPLAEKMGASALNLSSERKKSIVDFYNKRAKPYIKDFTALPSC